MPLSFFFFFCSEVLFPPFPPLPFLEGSLFGSGPVPERGGKGVALEPGPRAPELQRTAYRLRASVLL